MDFVFELSMTLKTRAGFVLDLDTTLQNEKGRFQHTQEANKNQFHMYNKGNLIFVNFELGKYKKIEDGRFIEKHIQW